jgi:predicted CoA-binding protein
VISLDPQVIEIIEEARTIAIVGCSSDPHRDSYYSARYFLDQGYTVIPINPKYQTVLEMRTYPDLPSAREAMGATDIVNIYRAPEFVLPHVEEAIQIRARLIWMQLGVVHEEAAGLARAAGIPVVMDQCLRAKHKQMQRMERA